jgi:hypothetical protein
MPAINCTLLCGSTEVPLRCYTSSGEGKKRKLRRWRGARGTLSQHFQGNFVQTSSRKGENVEKVTRLSAGGAHGLCS